MKGAVHARLGLNLSQYKRMPIIATWPILFLIGNDLFDHSLTNKISPLSNFESLF